MIALVLVWPRAAAMQSAGPSDAIPAEVSKIMEQAQQEIRAFRAAGGRNDDAAHPALKWSAKLWELREQHHGSKAGCAAAAASLRMLVRSGRAAEAAARADTLSPMDPCWEGVTPALLDGASAQNDYAPLVARLRRLLEEPSQRERPGLHYYLGLACKRSGQAAEGIAAFERVVKLAPGGSWAKAAEQGIAELRAVGVGQSAPAFTATARDGTAISLADLRGRTVLLIFWAST